LEQKPVIRVFTQWRYSIHFDKDFKKGREKTFCLGAKRQGGSRGCPWGMWATIGLPPPFPERGCYGWIKISDQSDEMDEFVCLVCLGYEF